MPASPHATPGHAPAAVLDGIAGALTRTLDTHELTLTQLSADTSDLMTAWRSLTSGGKRVRALLMYHVFRGIESGRSGLSDEDLYGVGAALELFQAAALFHDDVMDRSDTRRGEPTVHRVFAQRHRTSQWVGDPDLYGQSAAILLGDLSLVASEQLFRSATAPGQHRSRARDHFDAMRMIVTVGQFMDTHAQVVPLSDDDDAMQRALDVIATKTTHYSVVAPLLIGAALAGAPTRVDEQLRAFGQPLGTAFQLIDDDLGLYGDPAQTGKPAGDDLREGKRTVVLIEALRRASHAEQHTLGSVIVGDHHDEDTIAQALDIIESSGARQATLDRARAAHDKALRALDKVELSADSRQHLRTMTDFILQRAY